VQRAQHLFIDQNVYFLGFTLNLCTDAEAHSDGCPIPLAKSGICSGIFGDGPEQKLYIDGMNTHGFSGGPLLCSNEAGVFGAIGVVSGYEHRVVKARYYQEETGSGSRKTSELRPHI
jgi:hypothetical protein